MNETQLRILVKHIVREMVNEALSIKEFSVLDNPPSSLNGGQADNAQITDPNNQLVGAMSTADKMKLDRIQKKQKQDQLKQKQMELDTAKKKLDFTKKDERQMQTSQIPQLQKTVQQLKMH